MELFQIDYDELVPFLATKCASSATLHDHEGSGKKDAQLVQIQGQHIDTVVDILTKKYKVPSKYIETENKVESKKKKK